MTNNITLHKVLKAVPEKVFRAFSDPVAYAWWIPPYGFLCNIETMDFRVGGAFRMSFTNFSTNNSHSFGGTILDLVPGKLLRYSDRFDNPELDAEMITTVVLKEVLCGTDITITQEGIPDAIPVEMCYLGWQESLEKLAKLVEPEIGDE